MNELPLTPERVWRADPGAVEANHQTKEASHMSELNRATILGTGTMGPGMGAVLARAGLQVTLFDVKPEALERAAGHGRHGRGRARPPRGARRATAAALALRDRPRGRARRSRDRRSRRSPSSSSSSSRCSPSIEAADLRRRRSSPPTRRASRSPRLADGPRAPRARDRLALVQPAASDPDERGDHRRAHRARGHRARSRS